jgi:hypothetical protein
MTGDVDVAAIKAEHQSDDPEMDYSECMACCHEWPCLPYLLAEALERAQAASEGVDMLVADAERRGAVKALRAAALDCDFGDTNWVVQMWLRDQADEIENGADL